MAGMRTSGGMTSCSWSTTMRGSACTVTIRRPGSLRLNTDFSRACGLSGWVSRLRMHHAPWPEALTPVRPGGHHALPGVGSLVALGSVAPELVGCAGAQSLGVELDLPVDNAEGLLQVGDLLLHLRLVPAQDLEPLGLVAGARQHQLRVVVDLGQRH